MLLQELLSLDHGRPIEDVAFFPSGQSLQIELPSVSPCSQRTLWSWSPSHPDRSLKHFGSPDRPLSCYHASTHSPRLQQRSGSHCRKRHRANIFAAEPGWAAGAMLATAGGTEVRVWDVLGSGRLVARLTNFQKTVTCICLSPVAGPDSEASARLLAGSLDGHVRVSTTSCLQRFSFCHLVDC